MRGAVPLYGGTRRPHLRVAPTNMDEETRILHQETRHS